MDWIKRYIWVILAGILWLAITLPFFITVLWDIWRPIIEPLHDLLVSAENINLSKFKSLFQVKAGEQAIALRWSIIALASLVGAPILFWRTWRYDVQTRTDEKRVGNDTKRLLNEQFVEAVKLLGATRDVVGEDGEKKTVPAMELRLGAIYALEKLSKDAPDEYFETVMDILSAYVRDNTRSLFNEERIKKHNSQEDIVLEEHEMYDDSAIPPIPKSTINKDESTTDIKTIFEVFCRRADTKTQIDLRRVFIVLQHLPSDTKVININFNESIISFGTCERCGFQNNSFSETHIEDTHFAGCHFSKGDAMPFNSTTIKNVNFDYIQSPSDIKFFSCDFYNCKFSDITRLTAQQFPECTVDSGTEFKIEGKHYINECDRFRNLINSWHSP